ncbi:MAG TPA: PIG-L family deacetylase [Candidatus Limnocylindrales bacterium]|nr:PIG-L family deacetylase [Candidatus Limnocylindrales bacterium]
MTHVFIAPHPDDIALSCGGLVASLRDLGQSVTILTVFSGSGQAAANGELSPYQRAALGFGSKVHWPLTEAFRRDNIAPDYVVPAAVGAGTPWQADPERIEITQERANTQARQFWQRAAWTRSANITNDETDARPVADSIGGQGSLAPIDYDALDVMERRKVEDERFAYFSEASVIFLDLPDAVYRGYEGDEQLLGTVREDDPAPYDLIRSEILRLEPQMVYFPLGVGGHVDHQVCREIGLSLLAERRAWVMPGPSFVGRTTFYEDFPYSWWTDYDGPNRPNGPSLDLPSGVSVEPQYADISDVIDRKAAGIQIYASQLDRLFESPQALLDDLYGFHARTALAGGVNGLAERYWATVTP